MSNPGVAHALISTAGALAEKHDLALRSAPISGNRIHHPELLTDTYDVGRNPPVPTGVRLSRVTTPLGPMLLGTTAEAVCLLEFCDRRRLETQLRRLEHRLECAFVPGRDAPGREMERELAAYFAGRLREFHTPLLTPGSDFQQRVWAELRNIPYADVRSYAEQARAIGAPTAVRAVARSNGDNRIAIVIPCHRVIGSNGALAGYGGGIWRKRWLLEREGVRLPVRNAAAASQA